MDDPEAKPQHLVNGQKLTRRQMLKAVGATIIGGGAAVFSKSVTAEVDSEEVPFVTGTLIRSEPPDLLHLSSLDPNQPASQTTIVKVPDTATVSRGLQGIVSDTRTFMPGDKVVVEGEWRDGIFMATTLMSLYYSIEGKIIERKQERLETTAGVILLTPDTEPAAAAGYEAEPLAELAVGDEITALAWIDPTNNTYVATKVGTRE